MSPAWIRTRKIAPSRRHPKGTTRYMVTYRLRSGGENTVYSAGTFATRREALLRRDLVGGWIAQGLDPKRELAKLGAREATRSYREWAEAYKLSRIDISDETRRNLETHLKRLVDIFGETDPFRQTVSDQIEAVGTLAARMKPSSVSRFWATHRLILDFAGVEPNPARNRAVKLPTVVSEELSPPSATHLLALLSKLTQRWRLPLVTAEQTAMTVGELEALSWGDVDLVESRFRLRRSTVKAAIRARARWVQVPEWLMELIAETCPLEDRVAERRVFPGFTGERVRVAMRRACKAAGVPAYSPHDLRHRRISLWHGQGIPARQLAERAGHTKPSMSLDVYSHVMPLDEAPIAALQALLLMTR